MFVSHAESICIWGKGSSNMSFLFFHSAFFCDGEARRKCSQLCGTGFYCMTYSLPHPQIPASFNAKYGGSSHVRCPYNFLIQSVKLALCSFHCHTFLLIRSSPKYLCTYQVFPKMPL